MLFHNKYLKYKTKYINLKQTGGDNPYIFKYDNITYSPTEAATIYKHTSTNGGFKGSCNVKIFGPIRNKIHIINFDTCEITEYIDNSAGNKYTLYIYDKKNQLIHCGPSAEPRPVGGGGASAGPIVPMPSSSAPRPVVSMPSSSAPRPVVSMPSSSAPRPIGSTSAGPSAGLSARPVGGSGSGSASAGLSASGHIMSVLTVSQVSAAGSSSTACRKIDGTISQYSESLNPSACASIATIAAGSLINYYNTSTNAEITPNIIDDFVRRGALNHGVRTHLNLNDAITLNLKDPYYTVKARDIVLNENNIFSFAIIDHTNKYDFNELIRNIYDRSDKVNIDLTKYIGVLLTGNTMTALIILSPKSPTDTRGSFCIFNSHPIPDQSYLNAYLIECNNQRSLVEELHKIFKPWIIDGRIDIGGSLINYAIIQQQFKTCDVCTLKNPADVEFCLACNTEFTKRAVEPSAAAFVPTKKECKVCTYENPIDNTTCDICTNTLDPIPSLSRK
jgi:hypothetical protein